MHLAANHKPWRPPNHITSRKPRSFHLSPPVKVLTNRKSRSSYPAVHSGVLHNFFTPKYPQNNHILDQIHDEQDPFTFTCEIFFRFFWYQKSFQSTNQQKDMRPCRGFQAEALRTFTRLSSQSVWKGWSSKWSTCLIEDAHFGHTKRKSTKPFGFNKKRALVALWSQLCKSKCTHLKISYLISYYLYPTFPVICIHCTYIYICHKKILISNSKNQKIFISIPLSLLGTPAETYLPQCDEVYKLPIWNTPRQPGLYHKASFVKSSNRQHGAHSDPGIHCTEYLLEWLCLGTRMGN